MRQLFLPAILLMNRLSYAMKFILIGTVFLAIFAYVSYLQIDGAEKQRIFNQKESWGVEYIKPSFRLLQLVQDCRNYSAAVLAGDTTAQKDLDGSKAQILSLFPAIEEVEKKYREEFKTDKDEYKTSDRWNEIKVAWQGMKDTNFKNQKESFDAYSRVSGLVSDWILNYAGNYSNLILDPDLDSYWLMDAFVGKLPQITEDVSKASAMAIDIASRTDAAGLKGDEKIDLTGLYTDATLTVGGLLDTDMKTSYDYSNTKDGFVPTKLSAPVKVATDATRSFADLLKTEIITADKIKIKPKDILESAKKSLSTTYDFYSQVAPVLDTLIMIRVHKYERDKRLGLGLTIGAALLLAYVFVGFFLAVQGSVQELSGATVRMINGTTETFKLNTRDELGIVAESYNKINKALVEARNRENIEKENKQLQENILGLLDVVADAADGNLTVRATVTEGALGNVADALNQMLESLTELVSEIKHTSGQSDAAIAGIRAAAQRMASGATLQANEVDTASKSINIMSSSIEKVSVNADTAAAAAKRTQDASQAGSESVQNVVRGMETLRANVQAGAKKIKNLGDRSMEITSIVATIAKISDQTNMLALNAAIEAARAGEHGRGFSVVADEVRKLAERTATATQEIEKLVKDIQTQTNESVAAIEQQTQVVEEEAHTVANAGDTLLKIQQVSTQSAELIGAINAEAKQQVLSAGSMVKTMSQVSQIAQQTRTGADQTLESSGELAKLSQKLILIVNKFNIGDAGEVLKGAGKAEPIISRKLVVA